MKLFDSINYSSVESIDHMGCITSCKEPLEAIMIIKSIHKQTSMLVDDSQLERDSISGKVLDDPEFQKLKNELLILSEKYSRTIKHYLENPMIIDAFMNDIISELVNLIYDESSILLVEQYFNYIFILYTTIRVKGFIRNFGQDIKDIHKVIQIIEKFHFYELFDDKKGEKSVNTLDIREEIRLTVLFGLVLLIVCSISIPFNLQKIHSKLCVWIDMIIKNTAINPMEYGICHDIIPALFSKFLHRADTSSNVSVDMIKWCVKYVDQYKQNSSNLQPQVFLSCLAAFFKSGGREKDIDKAQYTFHNIDFKYLLSKKSIKIQISAYKLLQSIGVLMLKPIPFRIKKKSHIKVLSNENTLYKDCQENDALASTSDSSAYSIEIPVEVEDILEFLLKGLGSENFNTRWSSAKGVGRICEKLTKELVNEIVENIINLIDEFQPSECWQGACLVFGELARRSLINSIKLPEIILKVKKALIYEDRYATLSHGTFVRDAACYVCWTFSRAFSPEQFQQFTKELIGNLLCVALFDNELICRRAASAVIQELVGRMGNIPHGIFLVTNCDYTSVKSLEKCYTTLAPLVYTLESYRECILDHIVNYRLTYWEIKTRNLASITLSKIATNHPTIFIKEILDEIVKKVVLQTKTYVPLLHGYVLGYSNIVYVLGDKLNEYQLKFHIDQITQRIHSFLLECRSTTKYCIQTALIHFYAKLTIYEKIYPSVFTYDYYEMVFKDVHSSLLSTNKDLNDECLIFFDHVKSNLSCQDTYLYKIYDDYLVNVLLPIIANSKKQLLALSKVLLYLPKDLAAKNFDLLYQITLNLFQMDLKAINDDIDNIHVKALSINVMFILLTSVPHNKLKKEILNDYLERLIHATQDYTTNKQGDVGIHVRMAAVENIPKSVEWIANLDSSYSIDKNLMEILVGAILRQSAERIQKLRTASRISFVDLLLSNNTQTVQQCSIIDHYDDIVSYLRENGNNWCLDSNAFIINYHMLRYSTYAYYSFLGFLAFLSSSGCVDLENQKVKNVFFHLETISNSSTSIQNIIDSIILIINNYSNHTRIRDSLIICLEPLLCFNILKKGSSYDRERLSGYLLTFLVSSINTITVVSRLKQIIDSLIFLMEIITSSHQKFECLNHICNLINHKYPSIRVYAVERIYVYLTLIGSSDNWCPKKLDQLQSLLLDNQWDQDLAIIQPKFLQIKQLLSQIHSQ